MAETLAIRAVEAGGGAGLERFIEMLRDLQIAGEEGVGGGVHIEGNGGGLVLAGRVVDESSVESWYEGAKKAGSKKGGVVLAGKNAEFVVGQGVEKEEIEIGARMPVKTEEKAGDGPFGGNGKGGMFGGKTEGGEGLFGGKTEGGEGLFGGKTEGGEDLFGGKTEGGGMFGGKTEGGPFDGKFEGGGGVFGAKTEGGEGLFGGKSGGGGGIFGG